MHTRSLPEFVFLNHTNELSDSPPGATSRELGFIGVKKSVLLELLWPFAPCNMSARLAVFVFSWAKCEHQRRFSGYPSAILGTRECFPIKERLAALLDHSPGNEGRHRVRESPLAHRWFVLRAIPQLFKHRAFTKTSMTVAVIQNYLSAYRWETHP